MEQMNRKFDSPVGAEYFAICNLSAGSNAELPISADDYGNLVRARRVLNETVSLEEKFSLLVNNYRLFEHFVHEITLDHMLYFKSNWSEFRVAGAEFSKHLLSLLSSARLYIDTIESHVGLTADDLDGARKIKAKKSELYDSSFGYRFMEALRNYSQHHALPVHSSSFDSQWNDRRDVLVFVPTFILTLRQVPLTGNLKKLCWRKLKN